jgi:uncharacterized phage-associated protein
MNTARSMNIQPKDARGVANLILDRADQLGIQITNMAINKIIYFVHAWCLVSFGRPFVVQSFEAWQHGPLIQDVYHSFKIFGDKPITGRAKCLDRPSARYIVCELDWVGNELELFANLVDHYAAIPAIKLRNMTHAADGPWDRIWNYEGPSNPGMRIPNELIQHYYRAKFLDGVEHAYSKSTEPFTLRTLY